MLVFNGIQKTTLVDFPGQVACTLFLPKCNFRCPYCYNSALVFEQDTGVKITEQEAFDFLESRKNLLDGVCVTGGEPSLHAELPDFFRKLKEKGFLVKLDTNGSNPQVLKKLFDEKLVDYVAMDIKAPLEKYPEVCNASVDLKAIAESVKLIRESGINYEFRTTVLPKFIGKDDLLAIGKWLNGSKLYALQQFFSEGNMLDPSLKNEKRYSRVDIELFAEMLNPFFGRVEVRNV